MHFHIIKHGDKNHFGDVVYMDEYIGTSRRLTFSAVVTTASRPNKIVWQMKKAGVRLPAFVTLELADSPQGVCLRHELKIGYAGLGRVIDPFIRLYFSRTFQAALTAHCNIEWAKLAEYLNPQS